LLNFLLFSTTIYLFNYSLSSSLIIAYKFFILLLLSNLIILMLILLIFNFISLSLNNNFRQFGPILKELRICWVLVFSIFFYCFSKFDEFYGLILYFSIFYFYLLQSVRVLYMESSLISLVPILLNQKSYYKLSS
jgi:hypothetical protein